MMLCDFLIKNGVAVTRCLICFFKIFVMKSPKLQRNEN